MIIQHLKKKKKNNNSSDRKKIRLLKVSAITKTLSDKHEGKQVVEHEIKTLKQQMEFILGVTKTGLDIIDSEFNIRYIDPEWAKTYGDQTGRKCYEYFMGGSAPCPGCGIPRALKKKKPTVTEEILVKENCRPIQVTTIPFQNSNGEWLVAEVNLDISERKRIEEALLKAHEELETRVQERTAQLALANEAMQLEIAERRRAEEALRSSEETAKRMAQENAIMAEIGRIISSTLNIEEVYDLFAREVYKLIPFDGIAINIINHEKGTVTVPYVSGMSVPGFQPGDAFPLAGSVTGEVARERSGLIIQTEDREELQNRFPTVLSAFDAGLRSVISVPLISKDQVIGTIHFRSTKSNAYSDQNLKLAESVASHIAGAVATVQLFSERKRVEGALRESENKYRELTDFLSETVFECDENGKLLFTNRQGFEAFGYTQEDFDMGLTVFRMVIPEDREKGKHNLERLLRGEKLGGTEYTALRKDGSIFPAIISSNVIFRENRPVGLRGLVIDITDPKKAEEALRESEQKYRTILENIEDGYYEVDLSGNFTFFNDPVCRLFGHSKDELMGMNDRQYTDQENAKKLYQTFNKVYRTGEPTKGFGWEIIRKDGTRRFIEASVSLVKNAKGQPTGFRGIVRDITERKRAEVALRESEAKYRRLHETMMDAFVNVDMAGRIQEANRAYQAMVGYSEEELRQLTYMGLTPEKWHAFEESVVKEQILVQGHSEVYEKEYQRKDGTIFPVELRTFLMRDDAGNPVGMWAIARDITERKRAEEALRESEKKYRGVIENIQDVFYRSDFRGRLIMGSPSGAEMFGYNTIGEMIGAPLDSFWPDPKDRKRLLAQIKATGSVKDFEAVLKKKDGTMFNASFTTHFYYDDYGNFQGTEGIIRDITERKRAEEALAKRIVALTQPLDAAEGIAFEDLFNLDDIQRLQNLFAKACGVASIITRPDGTPITQGSNATLFCDEIIRKSPRGLRNCQRTDVIIGRYNPSGPIIQPCLSAGLCHAAASITVGGHHVANWTIGQVRNEAQSEERIMEYGREIGADDTAFQEAFRKVPIMSQEQFEQIAHFLFAMANQISTTMYQNIQQARFITERKRAEVALRESEEKFRNLVETTSDWIWETDANGNYSYASPKVRDLLGYKPDEVIGRKPFDFMPPDEIERVGAEFTHISTERRPFFNLENVNLRKDGNQVILETSGVPRLDSQGNFLGYRGIDRDITERKRAEAALRESENRLRLILDSIQAAILIIDPETHTIVDLNPAAAKLIGAPKEKIAGSICHQYICPTEMGKCPITDLKQKVENKERILLTAHGETHPIIKTVVPIAMGGQKYLLETFIDITERKRAEEALRKSEERYRTILENIEDGYFELDLAGNFTFFNNALCKILGYSNEKTMGMNYKQFMGKEAAKRVFQIYQHVYTTGKSLKTFDYKIIRKDGAIRFIESGVSIIRNEKGERVGFRGVARDITDRKQSEEALRQSEERYRTLVEESFDGIFIQRGPKIIFANQRLYEMLGYDEGELLEKDHWQVYRADYHELTRERARARMRGEHVPSQYEVKLQRKDGSSFDGEINARRIMLGNEAGIQVWARDITEHKQSEELLRAEKKRFQTLSEQAPFGMVMIDQTGTFKYVNPKFKELFGYDLTDVPNGKTWFRKAYPDPACRHQVIADWIRDLESAKKGEKRPRIFAVRCKDGTEKIVNFISVQLETDENLMACEDITERTRAEEALRESEERFRLAFKNANIGMCLVDLQGRLTRVNHQMCKIFGYTQEELEGMTVNDIAHPDDLDISPTFIQHAVSGKIEHTNFEKRYIHKDGHAVWGQVSSSLVRDGQGVPQHFISHVQDITERKRIEEALRESEERYRTILENIEDGYYEVDLPGNFTFFNDPVCRLFGYSKDELMGMNDRQYTDQENAKKLFQTFNKVYKTGKPTRGFDWEIIRKDGTKRYIEASISLVKNQIGQPIGYRGIVRDITERKEAEEALQESEKKFRVLTETAASGIFIHRGEKFLYVNPASEAMSGYTREELLKMNFWDIIHPDFRELVRQRAQARQQDEPVPSRYELKILTKNGEERWIDLTVGMINFGGEPAILGTDFDITERKHAEEEMRALEEQLRQSQKMEAVGLLAGGIAHDFNNLLTVINGYSQLSLLDLKESNPLWGNIQEIQKATQKATDLTRQLLAFSRRQILDPKVLDLNTLLRDLNKMLRRIIGEDIELSTQFTNHLGRVKIDPGQFEQMILNLAVNARDAMPSGGKLSIETSNVELDGEYAFNHVGVIPGHYVRLSVSDNGVGMSKEVKERIFEHFFTTKEKGKGTGLGLSTVYGIVKQSGGNIWAYSEPGHGTTLKIYLPRVEEALDTLHGRDETDSLPGGSETVLLVEDEQDVRSLAYRLLRQQGYKVLVAANGVEALHIAREHSGEKIDLLLTDVVMPQMSGKELADQLKTSRPDVKILYTSGYTDDDIVHHGMLDPGTHFLQKPFSHKDLSRKVREVLDR